MRRPQVTREQVVSTWLSIPRMGRTPMSYYGIAPERYKAFFLYVARSLARLSLPGNTLPESAELVADILVACASWRPEELHRFEAAEAPDVAGADGMRRWLHAQCVEASSGSRAVVRADGTPKTSAPLDFTLLRAKVARWAFALWPDEALPALQAALVRRKVKIRRRPVGDDE